MSKQIKLNNLEVNYSNSDNVSNLKKLFDSRKSLWDYGKDKTWDDYKEHLRILGESSQEETKPLLSAPVKEFVDLTDDKQELDVHIESPNSVRSPVLQRLNQIVSSDGHRSLPEWNCASPRGNYLPKSVPFAPIKEVSTKSSLGASTNDRLHELLHEGRALLGGGQQDTREEDGPGRSHINPTKLWASKCEEEASEGLCTLSQGSREIKRSDSIFTEYET